MQRLPTCPSGTGSSNPADGRKECAAASPRHASWRRRRLPRSARRRKSMRLRCTDKVRSTIRRREMALYPVHLQRKVSCCIPGALAAAVQADIEVENAVVRVGEYGNLDG